MLVTPIQFDAKMINGPADDLAVDHPHLSRSTGLHLSQIYQDLEQSYQDKQRADCTPEELAFYAAGGFMWERVFSTAFADSIIKTMDLTRPGEFQLDGISGSPDLIRMEPFRVVETKATWRSINKMDKMEKWFWLWTVQMKGYCRLVGTQEVELYAFFVNGNWAPPVPRPIGQLYKFSQMEIEENWGMLKAHARRRGWLK